MSQSDDKGLILMRRIMDSSHQSALESGQEILSIHENFVVLASSRATENFIHTIQYYGVQS